MMLSDIKDQQAFYLRPQTNESSGLSAFLIYVDLDAWEGSGGSRAMEARKSSALEVLG